MAFDRRRLLIATALLTTSISACAKGAPAKPDDRSASVVGDWASFRALYLRPDGRIVDTGNNGISHSEGQGYGMILAEAAGDRTAFDSMLAWTEEQLLRPDVSLFAWRYVPDVPNPVEDPNNATDGDMLIAWALMRASVRWQQPAHMKRAKEILAAIRARLIHVQAGRSLLLPALTGFVHPDRVTINLSYYIWSALDHFRKHDPSEAWNSLIRDGERLTRDARFGPSRLPTDWIDVTAKGIVLPAADKPPRFGFDAIRMPLYQLAGDRRSLASDIATYWRRLASRGATIPAWIDVITGEQAPYGLSAGGTAIVTRLLGNGAMPPTSPPAILGSDYYSDVLTLLSRTLSPRREPFW
ncbi:glycosyl hydrolase family 8 [Polymorphobacter sp.]|uniref:glycosyl hydrolase family 8 n=1 Tax=Polymorphobacter sp. TaxID=1909290 RepID=UPI003F6F9BDD